MKTNLITEIQRVKELMGISDFTETEVIYENYTGKKLLVERNLSIIERMIYGGLKSASDIEELLLKVEKSTGTKISFGDLENNAEFKKLTRSEKIKKYSEVLEEKIKDIEEKIKTDSEWSSSKVYNEFPETKPFIDYERYLMKQKSIDLGTEMRLKLVEKFNNFFSTTEPYKSILENALADIEIEIKLLQSKSSNVPLTEAKIHQLWWENLNERINEYNKNNSTKQIPVLESSPELSKWFNDKWLKEEYPRIKPTLEPEPIKLPAGQSAVDFAPKSAGGKNLKVPAGEQTRLSKMDVALIRFAPTVRLILNKFVNFLAERFKFFSTTQERLQKNMSLLESLDIESAMKEGGDFTDITNIVTRIVADLESESKAYGDFLRNYNKFVDELKLIPGFTSENLTKLNEKTVMGYGVDLKYIKIGGQNLEEYIKQYERRFKDIDSNNPTYEKYFNTWYKTLKEGSGFLGDLFEGLAKPITSKTLFGQVLERLTNGIRNVKFSRITSYLTYFNFFTPRQIGFMIRQSGTGFLPILGGLVMSELVLVVWNKYLRVIWTTITAFFGIQGEREFGESRVEQFWDDVGNILWPSFQEEGELAKQNMFEYVKPTGGFQPWYKQFKEYFSIIEPWDGLLKKTWDYVIERAKDKRDPSESINTTFNEQSILMWQQFQKTHPETSESLMQKASTTYRTDFGTLGNICKPTGYNKKERELTIQQNDIPESEADKVFEKIYNSRFGNLDVSVGVVDKNLSDQLRLYRDAVVAKEKISQDVASTLEKLKDKIDIGCFKDKNNYLYTVRKANGGGVSDYEFIFKRISFKPFYELYNYKDIGKLQVYFYSVPDKKPTRQEKRDLEKAGINLNGLNVETNGNIDYGDYSDFLKTELTINNRLSKKNRESSEIPYQDLTLMEFYKKL